MGRKIIITCAITGSAKIPEAHPAFPITPAEVAESAVGAVKAGAAAVHIHVRDPETGAPTGKTALYKEVLDRIADTGVDAIMNLTTGYGARYIPSDDNPAVGGAGTTLRPPEQRLEHVLALRPEICSLDIATLNFGQFAFVNTPPHLEIMGREITRAGIKPELEVFDMGHIMLANHMIKEGMLAGPGHFQLCLGIPWAMPASRRAMEFMCDHLPEGATWAAFGISRHEFPMVEHAIELGGHVRVGLEDNLYLEKGVYAISNAVLVERAVELIHSAGAEVATVAESRQLLSLPPKA